MTVSTVASPTPDSSRLNEFWQWWTGELRALVPARVVGWVVGEVAVTDVMVDGAGIKLMRVEAGRPIVLAAVPAAEISTHPALRGLSAKGNDRVRILLGADQVLLKTISLPAAIEENLREVMGFELDRHTPFMASQVYYDVKLQRRDAQRETIEVLLAVAARSVVEPLLIILRQAGLSINSIGVADVDAGGQAIELLPASDRPARKWGHLLRLNLALLLGALFLGLIALLLPIWQKREEVIALNPLVSKASADYEVSQRVFDEYTKLATEYNFITGKKQTLHPSLTILEELTKISPDTTSVQNFELKTNGKTREVTLIGEAQAASKVIEVLEQSPLFQNATQRSQTRRGSSGANEWFHIATELKPKVLPTAVLTSDKSAETVVEKSAPTAPLVVPAAEAPPVGGPAVKAAPSAAPPAPVPSKIGVPTATVTVPPLAKPAAEPATARITAPFPTVTVPPPAKPVNAEPLPAPANQRQP